MLNLGFNLVDIKKNKKMLMYYLDKSGLDHLLFICRNVISAQMFLSLGQSDRHRGI